MQTKVIKIDPANIDAAAIAEAAKLIDAGGLVAFPTETVYGIACRVESESLRRLNELKGRPPEKPYSLHIGRKSDVVQYVPAVGLRAKKLMEKLWPGPLTIAFELNNTQIRAQRKRLAAEAFENLYRDNSIGIRLPDDPTAMMLLQKTAYPVVAPSVNLADQPPATDAGQILAQFDGKLDMVLDAGPSRYKKSSTVVKISQYDLKVLREGVYTAEQILEAATVQILFVCTGNTCRSPMAEGMTRKYLSEKVGCAIDQLDKKGYKILSAGTMGIVGMAATVQAIASCEAKGVDIKAHRSSAISRELIDKSDLIYAMSRGHVKQIVAVSPSAADRCKLLAENVDIPDPIGQSQKVYDETARTIKKAVERRVDEWTL